MKVTTYGDPKIYGDRNLVSIGKFCSFAPGVSILSRREHKMNRISTFPFYERLQIGRPGSVTGKGPIIIGNDVWVGLNAIILSGVTIGNGAVIGAGSVVSKDVPGYMVAAGNPIRHIRPRFDLDIIKLLEALAWWDWPIEKIEKYARNLSGKLNISWLQEMVNS